MHVKQTKFVCVVWGLLAGFVIPARGELQTELHRLLSDLPHRQTQTGACVVDLQSGKPVFGMNEDTALIPASNEKVFAMVTALALLGQDHEFTTLFATDGENLIVIGDGDPALGDPRLANRDQRTRHAMFDKWADFLIRESITAIPGDIILDASVFDDQLVHPTWDPNDLGKWYATPVSGLGFNNNCIEITVIPARVDRAPPSVEVYPPAARRFVTNECRSGGRRQPVLHHVAGTYEYVIRGECPKKWPFGAVAFPNPPMLTGAVMRERFEKKGIRVLGELREERVRLADGSLPSNVLVLAAHKTPIADVLNRAGKNSQNLFAECLLKHAGRAHAQSRGLSDLQGSWLLGATAVEDVLQNAGVDTTNMVIADGSGLSRKNRCTAKQLAAMLQWAHAQPFGALFRESLSIAGVDGSLRKRLKKMPHRIFAKTGTMKQVRTLSGFVFDEKGERGYAFAVMFNGYSGPSTPYREIQDQFCATLARELDRLIDRK